MKIIHLTDPHIIGAVRANLFGLNPTDRLKKALKSINKHHSDAKFIAITGDLADNATKKAYKNYKNIIEDSKIPVYSILGNHDNRSFFKEVFTEFKDNDFIQYSFTIKKNAFIFLDTLDQGKMSGTLCSKRYKWLTEKLEEYKEYNVYLFMHHHPIKCGLYEFDTTAHFRNKNKFWKTLGQYKNIRHISFGHLHRIINANRDGISMHCTRSTAFQVALKTNTKAECLTNKEKPTYAIINIDGANFRIHHHEFLDENKIYECEGRWNQIISGED